MICVFISILSSITAFSHKPTLQSHPMSTRRQSKRNKKATNKNTRNKNNVGSPPVKRRKLSNNKHNSNKPALSPASSCSTSSTSPSPDHHIALGVLTLIANAKQGFSDTLIVFHSTLVTLLYKTTSKGQVVTAIWGDGSGDVQQPIWPLEWSTAQAQLQNFVGQSFLVTGSTTARHLAVAQTQYNKGISKYELKGFTRTQMSSVEEARYLETASLTLNPVKLDRLTEDYDGPTKFDIVAKIVSCTVHDYKYGPSVKLTIADDMAQKTVFVSVQAFDDSALSEDGVVIIKNNSLKQSATGYTNIVVGYLVPLAVCADFYSDQIAEFNELEVAGAAARYEFVESEYLECSVKKHMQKLRKLESDVVNVTNKTVNLELVGKYGKVYHEMQFCCLLNAGEAVYLGDDRCKKLKGSALEEAERQGTGKMCFSLKVEFKCLGEGKKLKDLLLWSEAATQLVGMTASDFDKLSETEKEETFDALTGQEFRVYCSVQYKAANYGKLQLRVCKIEEL